MKCFVAFGANLGKARPTVNRALRALQTTAQIRFLRMSHLYETEPVGPAQADFYNGVVEIETTRGPLDLLRTLLAIERKFGRLRGEKWGPRTIDLDLITYGRATMRSSELTLPHPRYHLRRFVLVPLCEIAPRATHPRLQLTHKALLSKLTLQGQRVTIAASWNGKRFSPFKTKKSNNNRSSR
jgi:2-amino-4-hydroxy-6-hydroxymethyldihydropteridine diphosphokinase